MMNRLTIPFTVSQALHLFLVGSLFASTEVLDQNFVVPPNPHQAHAYGLASTLEAAQTFTVGRTGLLSAVDVAIYRPDVSFDGTITVDISRVTAGTPDFSASGVLASQTVSNGTVPIRSVHDSFISEFSLHVDFLNSQLLVSPGEALAIILRPNLTGTNYYNWWANIETTPGYSGGSVFHRDLINNTITNEGGTLYDVQFRTFVAIPEPCSVVPTCLALLGSVPTIRRRRT